MEIKSIQDVFRFQKNLADEFDAHIAMLRERRAPRIEALLKRKEQILERAKANLQAAQQERDELVKLADERVKRRKDELERLEKRLQELDEKPARAPSETGLPAPPSKPVRGKRR